MEATLGTLEQYSNDHTRRITNIPRSLGSWIIGIFGCAHKEMSRPFSRHGETYRVCISCGARRSFDQRTWNSSGRYYFKPARTSDLQDIDKTALRCL